MKLFGFWLIILNILVFPTVAWSSSPTESNNDQTKIERAKPKETNDNNDVESVKSETEAESAELPDEDRARTKPPTPAERARFRKLAEADRLYRAGNKAAAVKLYRAAKEVWSLERERARERNEELAIAFSDPEKLSPAGKVFWRNYQQGKQQQLETKTISALKLLTTREPQFIPGHIHYAQALAKYERETESVAALDRAFNLYPNEPEILRAKMNADIVAENWLDASIVARQYALFNPDSPRAKEFKLLADEYLAEYQSNLRESITWNAIGNVIVGTVGFVLTGNLFGPLSALETTTLLLRGESAVGEAAVGQIKRQVPLLEDKAVNNYVDRIGHKIAKVSGREEFDYKFYVVMDDTLNAFALPGGKIFVHAGAIMKTDSEAELAGLLAHEVSHSALSHGFQLATKGNLTANIVGYVPYVGNTASGLIVLNYSRDMEKQADIFGTRILVNAGYAADGVRNLMAQLHESHQEEEQSEPPAWLSSHPNTEQRIAYMERAILDNNLDRFAYEGVQRHREIKQLVRAKWQKYEKCVKDVDSLEEAKVCAGERKAEEAEEVQKEREVEEVEEVEETG